jgi:hypothetical protein
LAEWSGQATVSAPMLSSRETGIIGNLPTQTLAPWNLPIIRLRRLLLIAAFKPEIFLETAKKKAAN